MLEPHRGGMKMGIITIAAAAALLLLLILYFFVLTSWILSPPSLYSSSPQGKKKTTTKKKKKTLNKSQSSSLRQHQRSPRNIHTLFFSLFFPRCLVFLWMVSHGSHSALARPRGRATVHLPPGSLPLNRTTKSKGWYLITDRFRTLRVKRGESLPSPSYFPISQFSCSFIDQILYAGY